MPARSRLRGSVESSILVATMDMLKVLEDLRTYKVALDRAITTLDRLARRRGELPGKRGRPKGAGTAGRRKRKPPLAS